MNHLQNGVSDEQIEIKQYSSLTIPNKYHILYTK
jgi:hypothetical protein